MAITAFTPVTLAVSASATALLTVPTAEVYRVNLLLTNTDVVARTVRAYVHSAGTGERNEAILYDYSIQATKWVGVDLVLPAGWKLTALASAGAVVNAIITGWKETA